MELVATYDLYVDKSAKGNVYCYIDLGYTRKFIDLNLAAELCCLPVASLYTYTNKTKIASIKLEK